MNQCFRGAALFGACLVSSAFAQNPDGPYWSEYQLPPGVLSTQTLGATCVIRTGIDVHIYSAIVRAWTVVPISGASAQLFLTNEYLMIQDGAKVHGYSARAGTLQTLNVSATAVLQTGSLGSSWVAVVLDGNVAWGFSSFFGTWVPQTFSTAAYVSTGFGSHMILVSETSTAYAFSAFYGTWVSSPVRPPATTMVFRNGAVIEMSSPDEVLAFSVYTNAWAKTSFTAPATSVAFLRDAYAMLIQGNEILCFSTLNGTFAKRTEVLTPTVIDGPNVVVSTSLVGTACYSPARGAWIAAPALIPASGIQVAQSSFGAYATLDAGSTLYAFSGLLGSYASLPAQSTYALTLGDAAAFANGGTNPSFAYSAILGAWYLCPSTTISDVKPMFNGVIAVTASGVDGFCARRGTWASLPVTSGLLVTQAAGAVTGIADNNALYVYDSTIGKWVTQPTTGIATFKVWRDTGVATDSSNTAYGYSLFHNTFESIPLKGTLVSSTAQDAVSSVLTTTHFYAFAGNGSLSSFSRFPEFSRFAVKGQPFAHVQAGKPGTQVIAMLGSRPGEISIAPFGILRLDPAGLVSLPVGAIPAGGVLRTTFAVPNDPYLLGATIHMQSILVPSAGLPWLSNASLPIFY